MPWSREKGWDIVIAGIRFLICTRLHVGSLRVFFEKRENSGLNDTVYMQWCQRWGQQVNSMAEILSFYIYFYHKNAEGRRQEASMKLNH